jgi:hypothetical protein
VKKRAFTICLLVFWLCAASFAAEPEWRPMKERADFRLDDREEVIQKAYEEIEDVYGDEADIENIKKSKCYIHTIRSAKYNAEIILVMIEDRTLEDPDCYYEVIFELPAMTQVEVGGIWLDSSLDEYVEKVFDTLYGDAEWED